MDYSLNDIKKNFYGINLFLVFKSLESLGYPVYTLYYNKRFKLNEKEFEELSNYILNNFIIDLKLKDKIYMNIKHLITLKTYKGFRHKYKLPLNGQRTKTNAQTQKKKRKK